MGSSLPLLSARGGRFVVVIVEEALEDFLPVVEPLILFELLLTDVILIKNFLN